jgi:hypothetical protein
MRDNPLHVCVIPPYIGIGAMLHLALANEACKLQLQFQNAIHEDTDRLRVPFGSGVKKEALVIQALRKNCAVTMCYSS